MPVLGPLVVGSYWPVGHVYSMTPKWRESHTDTDNTARPQDEVNRLEIVCDYGESENSFSITMVDLTDPKNPVPPLEIPNIYARLSRSEGWIESQPLTPTFITSGGVWTGEIKFDVTGFKQWIGTYRIVDITIDAEFPSDAPERVRAGYGTLVLRD